MNDKMKALAQRAVASKHWRWMPGMLVKGGSFCRWNQGTVGRVKDNVAVVMTDNEDDEGWPADYMVSLSPIVVDGVRQWNMLPDLTDPATRGCIVHLLHNAVGPTVFLAMMESRWYVGEYCQINMADRAITQLFATEAEALVAALEAADE